MIESEILSLQAEHPLLHAWGYGHNGDLDVTEARQEMLNESFYGQVLLAKAWLDQQERKNTISTKRWPSSYRCKHLAEGDDYISNGAMICAALLSDVQVRLTDYNPLIGVKV